MIFLFRGTFFQDIIYKYDSYLWSKQEFKIEARVIQTNGDSRIPSDSVGVNFDNWTNFLNQGLRYTPDFIAQSFAVQSDDAVTR